MGRQKTVIELWWIGIGSSLRDDVLIAIITASIRVAKVINPGFGYVRL